MPGDLRALALNARAHPGAAILLHGGPGIAVSHKPCRGAYAGMAKVVKLVEEAMAMRQGHIGPASSCRHVAVDCGC